MRNESSNGPHRAWWPGTALKAAALMLVWLLLSGHYDLLHILMGLISVVLILFMNRPRESDSPQLLRLMRWWRVLLYVPWLIKEMVLSALYVVRIVLAPRMPLDPHLVRFKSSQPNDVAKVILGNSITLTPGTLTVDIGQQEVLVHALTHKLAYGLLNGTMQTKVASLFTDHPGEMVFDVRMIPSENVEG